MKKLFIAIMLLISLGSYAKTDCISLIHSYFVQPYDNSVIGRMMHIYTGHAYKPINQFLRNNTKYLIEDNSYKIRYTIGNDWLEKGYNYDLAFAKSLQEIINNLSSNPQHELYRGLSVNSEEMTEYVEKTYFEGNVFSNPEFLSTTTNRKVAIAFATAQNTKKSPDKDEFILLEIKSESAKDISSYAIMKAEEESLIPPGGLFRVISVDKNKVFTTRKLIGEGANAELQLVDQKFMYVKIEELSGNNISPKDMVKFHEWAQSASKIVDNQTESAKLSDEIREMKSFDLGFYNCTRNTRVEFKICIAEERCRFSVDHILESDPIIVKNCVDRWIKAAVQNNCITKECLKTFNPNNYVD
ncbi:MAG: hypothetical protein A2381_12285 [Bdellovibrionales bacterium RIFOXYB1_FULL_37_110]|nr:MAG: hypothetical protein A2181_02005 [Bdellovibrionales bacterium RIFOXYA1_FULL_38_20]OFZ52274.1 MAG: hypothetical protein A2417_06125 [Bdellovibrionales bacterium RIFOXYC1_FULL_37_79]OFZ57261.1 MAG: hypothetical protein A2381_12285 [Bdellovibrionales bacterium RIFOXYB1_FULL_37_110]OFZ65263.1 MAG: hypothetical protein A2577_04720 [Bdellovibrionales bacterium RIFOXYD1_FULL_36_51]